MTQLMTAPILLLVLAPPAPDVSGGFQMTIRAANGTSYRAGEPIVIELAVRNTTDHRLFYTMSAEDLPSFEFAVEYVGGGMTQGGRLPMTRYGVQLLQQHDAAKNVPWFLGPGEEMAYRFPIGRMVDMTSSGTYSVTVRRSIPALPPRDAGPDLPQKLAAIGLTSNTLTVDVAEHEGSIYVRGPAKAPR